MERAWREIRTDRRTLIPEKTADAGGNTYAKTALQKAVRKTKELAETHETNTSEKSRIGGKTVQAGDERLKPLEQFRIAVSELVKFFGLSSKYGKD
jgi:hypothetical protein